MLVRSSGEVAETEYCVEWGNGRSIRLLVSADSRGYTVAETYVRPDTSSRLRYDNHYEACYCVDGSGTVQTGNKIYELNHGTLYAPELGEEHILSSEKGMKLISVFNPALKGTERHRIDAAKSSTY